MNDMTLDPRLAPGGNNPPETIADELAIAHKPELDLKAELLEAAKTVPAKVDDDETQTKVAELIKKTRTLERTLEKALDAAKAPHDEKVKAIRGFFKTHIEPLEKARKVLNEISESYLQRKAEAERLRLKAIEDEKRAEAERLLKLARDAEETQAAAQRGADAARQAAEDAASARAAAITDQEVAAADLAEAKAAIGRIRADGLAKAADYARRAKDGNPASDQEKAEAREAQETAMAAARETLEAAETALREARERAMAAKREQQAREAEEREAARKARDAEREKDAHVGQAVREEKSADKIAAKVDGSEADLARTRSLHGAVSTLQRRWVCEITDRTKLDQAALWPFINEDALSAALWKWMMAQADENRSMPGARIEHVVEGQTR